jgi:hypothetical protein
MPSNTSHSKEQRSIDFESKEKYLEKQVERADKKTINFDMIIKIVEKEYNLSIL